MKITAKSTKSQLLNSKMIEKIIKTSKNVAIIGISKNKDKPSYFVSKYLKDAGFNIYLINPKYFGEKILGKTVYKDLLDIGDNIDIVTVFISPEKTFDVLKNIGDKKPVIWFQPGTSFESTVDYLLKNNFNVVLERCMMSEYQKFL
ncbi:CoA-binding domain protein [Methanococcus vannielii SB]|uniref:CoA-binding domain protein n=1 Tax=Methanococcus vannielii (strain ATCC 35089 / DSM 1224 / JCM 13029 / OCM 148 / SB) TaxID=406327 RepID=A6URI5_METVS|nr:CoA-binding protein [Methanococcus vannielii]ABR55107.1 CoA-binding domain protein [Methanococcus vannielii SB]